MTIRFGPKMEALIQKDVERGAYKSVDEFVAQAVRMLHEQEQWLADNRSGIGAKIDHGFAQAQRGNSWTAMKHSNSCGTAMRSSAGTADGFPPYT